MLLRQSTAAIVSHPCHQQIDAEQSRQRLKDDAMPVCRTLMRLPKASLWRRHGHDQAGNSWLGSSADSHRQRAGGNNLWTKNYYLTRERVNLTTDTRTSTEYGTVRTYANFQLDFTQDRDSIAGGFTEVDLAFIQFAGFTFGKAVSQFDPQWALTKPYISSGFLAGSNNTTGLPQIAYTAEFGNGVSASIALENASPYRNAGLYNTANFIVAPGAGQFGNQNYGTVSNTFLGNSYGGNHIPDVVGNVRLDQKWGSLHFGAAMHTITPGFYGATNPTGHADDSFGFAVTGAVEFKDLPTGAGDSLKLEASYGKGATKYVFGGGTL